MSSNNRFSGRNLNVVKSHNTQAIFEIIRSSGSIAKSEIAKATGLTTAGVGKIVDNLLKCNLVLQAGLGESTGGRRPILYRVNNEEYYIVAINMSSSNKSMAVMSPKAELIKKYHVTHGNGLDLTEFISSIKNVLEDETFDNKNCLGVGVVVPGLLDIRSGTVLWAVDLNWTDIPLESLLKEELGLPVIVEKDTCAELFAEKYYGQLKNVSNAIYIMLNTGGIGSSIMINDEIYRGSRFMAGEIGHVVIDDNGPHCRCGQKGCLEAFLSKEYLLKTIKKISKGNGHDLSMEIFDKDNAGLLRTIFNMAEQGDNVALRVVRKLTRHIGKTLASMITFFNPENVVIGGEAGPEHKLLIDELREIVFEYGLEISISNTYISPCSFGKDQSLAGITALLFKEMVTNIWER